MQAETAYSGWIYVLAAGLCQGSFMLPMKCTKAWAWENTWLVFAVTAYLICPWLFVFATVPGVTAIYSDASPGRIALVIGMGFLWGLGALTFGLGVDAIGFSIGFAVILGVAACSGTLVPLLFLNPQLPDKVSLLITGLSLSVMLGGVAMCSVAGHWRESPNEQRNYRTGVLICVAAGLLSSCGNVGFVLGQPIIDLARRRGVDANFAPNVVWALLTISLFLCNVGYTNYRLSRNRTYVLFRRKWGMNLASGVTMGVLWMLGFAFYGAGVSRLGELGPSFGWSVLMSVMVLTANLLGIRTGEWQNAPRPSKQKLWIGMALLSFALFGLGAANQSR